MANKRIDQLTAAPSVALTDLIFVGNPTTGALAKATPSQLPINANNLTTGSIPAARFGAATIALSAINATGTRDNTTFLRGDGTWAVPPAGAGLSDGNKGDITVSSAGAAWAINAGAVTLSQMANMATASLLGRNSAGSGAPEVLSATVVTALLNVFTSGLKGLAPASGGGTTNFLRADGTWAAPPGGGGGGTPGGADTQLQYNSAGSFAGVSNLVWNNTSKTFTITGDSAGNATPVLRITNASSTAKRLIQLDEPVTYSAGGRQSFPFVWQWMPSSNGDGTTNNVIKWGFNIEGSTAGQSALFYSMEPDWVSGGLPYREAHLQYHHPDGTPVRLFSTTLQQRTPFGDTTNTWDFRSNVFAVKDLNSNDYFVVSKGNNVAGSAANLYLGGNQPVLQIRDLSGATKDWNVQVTSSGGTIIQGGLGISSQYADANLFLFIVGGTTGNSSIKFSWSSGNGVYARTFGSAATGTNANTFSFSDSQSGAYFIKYFQSSGNIRIGDATGADGSTKVQIVGTSSFSDKVTISASTTARASMNIPHGTAPTTPADGDIWTTTGSVFARVNGSTIDLGSGGGGGMSGSLTTGRVPRATGTTALADGVIRDDGSKIAIGGAVVAGNMLDVQGGNSRFDCWDASSKYGEFYVKTASGTSRLEVGLNRTASSGVNRWIIGSHVGTMLHWVDFDSGSGEVAENFSSGGYFKTWKINAVEKMRLSSTGIFFVNRNTDDSTGAVVQVGGGISTDPADTTRASWKFGEAITTTGLTFNTTGYVKVKIGTTLYNLALANLP